MRSALICLPLVQLYTFFWLLTPFYFWRCSRICDLTQKNQKVKPCRNPSGTQGGHRLPLCNTPILRSRQVLQDHCFLCEGFFTYRYRFHAAVYPLKNYAGAFFQSCLGMSG